MLPRLILLLVMLSLGSLVRGAPARAQTSPDAQARLWDAAMAGDTVAIVRALDDGAQIDSLDTRRNQNGRRALNWAAWYDHVPAIRLLVARGATVNIGNRTEFTPLHHAAEAGSVEAARALIAAGADLAWPNVQAQRPVDVARERNHPEIVSLLEAAERERRP